MIARRQRHQTGSLWPKSGSWYLRFYTNVGGERKQVVRFLALKDDKHHSKTCKAVQDLAAEMIAKENSVSSFPKCRREQAIVSNSRARQVFAQIAGIR